MKISVNDIMQLQEAYNRMVKDANQLFTTQQNMYDKFPGQFTLCSKAGITQGLMVFEKHLNALRGAELTVRG